MSKLRTPISASVSAEIMFASDRTCCVCNERGKTVQIHHIDDDPSNNSTSNLAVLCLECHNDTQVTGGFGRKLNAELVGRYRMNWLDRVASRRRDADTVAVTRVSGGAKAPRQIAPLEYSESRATEILDYVNELPSIRKALREKVQPEWDSETTSRVVAASYWYVDAMQGILVKLASYYPFGTFGDADPHMFFSEQVAARYSWHRSHAEPYGPGSGGTIVSILVSRYVVSDAEKMVEEMARSLVGYDDRFDWKHWPDKWNGRAI